MNEKSQQGIAFIWVVLAGALLIAGVGVVISKEQAQKTKESQQVPQSDEVKKEVDEKGEEFVSEIKEIIAKGTPMKCTYAQEGFTGLSFIKGKKMYSEIRVEGGTTTYTIIKDNCMWSWGLEAYQGTKMCFEEDIWDTSEAMPIGVEYRCTPTVFADSQFNPPANIDFMGVGEAMPEPPREKDLLKILPQKERSELESAIKEAQEVLKNTEVFNPSDIFNKDNMFKGLDEIKKQTQEQIQKNIEKQQQKFQPIDPKKIEEYFNQNPPAVPHEGKEFSPQEKEYYYRKYILKDPVFQW